MHAADGYAFPLQNMFLAIINDTYSDVKSEITQDVMPVGDYVCRRLKMVVSNLKGIFDRHAAIDQDVATLATVRDDGDAAHIDLESGEMQDATTR